MLKINLKLAIRNIWHSKLYTAINVIGLSLASAFCVLVYLYVSNEQSIDNFHHDQDRLFRVEVANKSFTDINKKPKSGLFSSLNNVDGEDNLDITPMALAPALKNNFPEVERAVRLRGIGEQTVRVGNQNFKESGENITYADADFFQVFNFPVLTGNASAILIGRNQAAISERLAAKYFGKVNPIGKILNFSKETDMPPITISGVFKNFPPNSALQLDMVMPILSKPGYSEDISSGNNSYNTFLIIKLTRNADLAAFRQKLNAFAKQYFAPAKPDPKAGDTKLYLRAFNQLHYTQGWFHTTDRKNLYQLSCLAVVILFIACLNYVLLTLTNTVSRSQDVGIRKTIGANRKAIVWQYYIQTQVLAFVSVLAGLLLAGICLPFFSSLIASDIKLSYFSFTDLLVMVVALSISLGLIAGIYPAFAMSGLKPLNMMRSFSAYRLNPFFSNFLVVLQFAVCVILVISSLIINKQIRFLNQTDIGYNKDQVLIMHSPYGYSEKDKTNALKEKIYHFAATEPSIQDATSSSYFLGGYNNNAFNIDNQKVMVHAINVDYNYFSFLNIPIIKGRTFSRQMSGDSAKLILSDDLLKKQKFSYARHAIVVNQTLYKLLGKPKLGVINDQMGAVIIGVCKDYHIQDLTQQIQPAYHTINKEINDGFWIRIKAKRNIPAALDKIKLNWSKLTGNAPLDYMFLDEQLAKKYDAYLRWMSTITSSCVLAIIISCLGLFGLSGITTINRTKEIGIRKVLGASLTNLFVLLNRGTIVLAAVAFVIAVPVAIYFSYQWLDNFAYRIKLDWLVFLTAGIISLVTAVIAVSYHTIKVAMENPANSLRSE